MNASDDRGIDVVREQIKNFAETRTLFSKGYKLIILDEADMMTTGASGIRQRWCNIITNAGPSARKHQLRHGYYAVILPHDEARAAGETRAETQSRSRTFFDTESPWRGVKDRKRFGVDNLVEYVSGLLVRLIEEA